MPPAASEFGFVVLRARGPKEQQNRIECLLHRAIFYLAWLQTHVLYAPGLHSTSCTHR